LGQQYERRAKAAQVKEDELAVARVKISNIEMFNDKLSRQLTRIAAAKKQEQVVQNKREMAK